MKTKLFFLLFALIAHSVIVLAEVIEHVQIGDLYYNLDTENKTAEVTYQSLSAGESNYSGLATISIPTSVEYNSVIYDITSIGYYAFSLCSDLTKIFIPQSVTNIGEHVFLKCTNLTTVEISNGVKSMGEGVFYACTNLTSITIPNSVTNIGDGIFHGCSSLMNVTLSNSISRIEDWTFINCYGLTNITIPESVTVIGLSAFEWCFHLTNITIPSSVTNIEGAAFAYCSGLTQITCEADIPPICNANVFDNVDKSIPLYVPAASLELYKTTEQWKEFDNIQAISHEAIAEVFVEKDKIMKLLNNGQLYIIRDGRIYTILGAVVQ